MEIKKLLSLHHYLDYLPETFLLFTCSEMISSPLIDYENIRLPKLIAFDLDGTIWTPDMYQLWGGGAPFRSAPNGKDLLDRSGSAVRLLGVTDVILHELKVHPQLQHIKVACVPLRPAVRPTHLTPHQ